MNERNGNNRPEGSRRASAPAASSLSSNPSVISAEEWFRRLASINQLVMNYLIIEGYKDAAEKFAQESGIAPPNELTAIEERMRVRNAIQTGDIETAIDYINDLNADLLDSHPRIYFHLQQQRMMELIRCGNVEAALEFAQDVLAPKAETHQEFLRELERTMSMLVWEGPGEKLDGANGRVRIANEVNQALLITQCQENESKLPTLLKTLHRLQEKFSAKVSYPKIVDYSSAKFDPPLPTDFETK